jgi:hypothetical protein
MFSIRAIGPFLALTSLSLTGCQGLFGPKGPPKDPLLLVRKPVEGKPSAGPPVALAYVEPTPPRGQWAQEHAPDIAGTPPRRMPAILTNRTLDPRTRAPRAEERTGESNSRPPEHP